MLSNFSIFNIFIFLYYLLISSSSVDSSDDMSFIFLFLLHFSHYYYILNNIHSLPLINISRERTNFDAWGYWRFYSRYYRGRAYSLTNAWKLDFLSWNWGQNHVLSTRVVRKYDFLLCSIWTVDHNDITLNFSRVHSNLRCDENNMKR